MRIKATYNASYEPPTARPGCCKRLNWQMVHIYGSRIYHLLIMTMNKLNLFIFLFWKFKCKSFWLRESFLVYTQLFKIQVKTTILVYAASYTNIDIIWWRIKCFFRSCAAAENHEEINFSLLRLMIFRV